MVEIPAILEKISASFGVSIFSEMLVLRAILVRVQNSENFTINILVDILSNNEA
jgi:hypothetical protein